MEPTGLSASDGLSGRDEKPEFSRVFDARRFDSSVQLSAKPEEMAAIAKRLELEAVDMLEATLNLRAGEQDTVLVEGVFRAKVVQTCVVSLEPVPADVEGTIDVIFEDAAHVEALLARIDPDDPDFLDIPEPIIKGKIDLGELLVQHLSLALEPYPRKEGLVFNGYEI